MDISLSGIFDMDEFLETAREKTSSSSRIFPSIKGAL
jgi:hypothetical protein